jgi:shikimate dehydrogenase
MITGKKQIKCGLIGEHLSHSFSPQIHRELADYSYELYEMPESEVGNFLKAGNFDAINVTIPYKKTVMPYLDEISDEAMRIGSVNTITKTKDGGLRGDNTDYYGFLYTVNKSGIVIKGKKLLILGTGGASLTAKTVCEDLGASEIVFVSRSGEINYENVYEKCADFRVIINCTPVGMYPNNGTSPVSLEKFKSCEGVIDMIYNPAKTALLLEAESLGIKHINGLPMLVAQAKKACELFLEEKIDDSEVNRITEIIALNSANIILVGMPGCGKTTVGKRLAEITGRKLLDTDEMIASSNGRTPLEIIKSDGEERFREIEHVEIKNAGKLSEKIISTGGGVVTRAENYSPLHQNGKIVFIHRPIEKLATDGRPLSVNLSEMYKKRLPMYRNFCDIEVQNNSDIDSCVNEILQKLKLI